jgi:F-type H+-transporting ATPase subunit b
MRTRDIVTSALATAVSLLAGLPLALAAEGPGHGGGHGEHGFDIGTFAFQLFNFGVLLFIVIRLGGGAVNKALQTRHDKMKTELEEASRLRADAEARLAVQTQRLDHLEKEVTGLRGRMADEAASEKARLIAASEDRARRIEHETRFLLDQQVKQAEVSFRAEVASAAARVAEELLRWQVNADDQRRLAEGFVSQVANPGGRKS